MTIIKSLNQISCASPSSIGLPEPGRAPTSASAVREPNIVTLGPASSKRLRDLLIAGGDGGKPPHLPSHVWDMLHNGTREQRLEWIRKNTGDDGLFRLPKPNGPTFGDLSV